MLALIGKKLDQTQRFLEDGTRIPVTRIDVPANVVLDLKTQEKNKYSGVALGYGHNPKNTKKSLLGLLKKTNTDKSPRLIKEIRVISDADLPELGAVIKLEEVLALGDIIQVTGMSKGKGFAGVVKRHHFSGGPKTHGQSDRHRAPGSIGQGTTPGRVFKGKKMGGHMGHENVTVTNLNVIDIQGDVLLVAGLVPGPANNILVIKKTGELGKKYIPLTKTQEQIDSELALEKEIAEIAEADAAKADEDAAKDLQAQAATDAPVESPQAESSLVEGTAQVEVEPTSTIEDSTATEEVSKEKEALKEEKKD